MNKGSSNGQPAVVVEGLHKSFGDLEVLKGVSLTAHEGDVVSMIGASGSGKSTFLRCINFLEMPTQGRIQVTGEDISLKTGHDGNLHPDRPPAAGTHPHQARHGLPVLQSVAASQCAGKRHRGAGACAEGAEGGSRRARPKRCCRKSAYTRSATQYPAFLSGGQQQRAAIARALAMEPESDAVRRADLGA